MADIQLSLGIDSKEAEKNIKSFGREATAATDKISRSFGGIATAIGGAIAAFAGFSIIKDVTAAASAQQDAINKLNTSLRSAGTFSTEASKEFQTFASELQKVTTVGDETTLELAALARNFTQTNEQAKQLTEAAIQLSAATGDDLTTSVEQLGKTFGGSLGRLSQTLPALKGLSQEALAAGGAIQFVIDRFGGSAQAQLQTFSGITKALSNNFGDLKEEIGFAIIENDALIIVLNKLNEIFINLGGSIKENRSVLDGFVTETIKIFVDGIGVAAQVIQLLVDGYYALKTAVKAGNIAFAEFAQFIITGFAESVRSGFEAVVVDGIALFRELIVGIVDLTKEIPGFDKFFPDLSGFVDSELGAIQTSFEKTADKISVNGQKAASFFDDFIKGQADIIAANEESRKDFQKWTDAITKGAADAVFEIDNVSKEVKNSGKDAEQAGKQIAKGLTTPVKDAAKENKETIASFLDEIARKSKPLEEQIKDVGIALTTAYNENNLEGFKKSYGELISLQETYKKQIEETAKAQEQAAKDAADLAAKQAQQTKDFGIGVASAILSGDATSATLIAELETDIARLSESLSNSEISEDKRLEIQEEILAKEKEIAKARQSQQKSASSAVAQIGGLVTDIFLPGFGGIASQLLTVLSGGPEQVKALITGFVDALPAVIDAIAESIPVIIEVLVEKAPEIIDALTSASPKIIAKLVEKAPDIIATLVRKAPDIALAVVRGIARQTFKVNFDFTDIKNKFNIAVDKIVEAFSELPFVLGDAAANFLNLIGTGAQNFVLEIIKGAGRFVEEILNKLSGGLFGGGGGDNRGFGVNNLSIGGLKNSGEDLKNEVDKLRKRSGLSFGLASTLTNGETAREFQERKASNEELRGIIDRLGESIGNALQNIVNNDNQRPLVIQLQVGQAQLANVLLQLNRNGFRTA